MKFTRCSLAVLLTSLSFNTSAIVNVENMRVGPEQPGISGNIDLSVSGKRGNTDKDEYGFDARVQRNEGAVTNFVVVAYDYGEASKIKNSDKSFIHGRHVEKLNSDLAWEAFAQMEENEFARLSFRGLLGGGLRFALAEEENRIALYIGAGAFYSRETLEARAGLTDHGSDNFGRANFYVSYKHKINEQLNLLSTTYYQPRLGHSGDVRALEQAALAVKMTDKLSLKISLDIAHDSRPPQSVKKTDTAYKTSLSYRF
ncbi:YdiY family protein [Pseudomonadota bacterium]